MITSRQLVALTELERISRTTNRPPSVRELCTALNVSSTSTVQSLLERLERQGLITHYVQGARSWRVTDAGQKMLSGTLSDGEMFLELDRLAKKAKAADEGNRGVILLALAKLKAKLDGQD